MNENYFETERLILRPWTRDDAEALFKYASDPDIGPPAGWPPHKSIEESLAVIENVYLSGPKTFAICLKEGSSEGHDKGEPIVNPIGCFDLMKQGSDIAEGDDECEVGFWIAKPFWGRGIIPEAAEVMLKHAFEDCGMNKVWCAYYEGNDKSKRTQEKIGFKPQWYSEGVDVPLLGEVRNGFVNMMTKEDFYKSRARQQ